MTLTLETLKIIGSLIGIAVFIGTIANGLFKRFEASLKARDDGLQKSLNSIAKSQERHADEMHRIDKDLLKLRAELPEKYVHKEDFVRQYTVIEHKLDSMSRELRASNELIK